MLEAFRRDSLRKRRSIRVTDAVMPCIPVSPVQVLDSRGESLVYFADLVASIGFAQKYFP